MHEIKTYLLSSLKPASLPPFNYHWVSSFSELIKCLREDSSECIIIDYRSEDLGLSFDLELFYSEAKEFSVAQALSFKMNTGKTMVSIDEEFNMIIEQVQPNDLVRDGLERAPLYYFSKERALEFIKEDQIYLPLFNHGLPMAFPKKSLDYRKKVPALFLDRDGVINKDFGYVHRHEDIEYIEEIFPIIKLFNKRNWPVFVLTNQSGVAQGKYNEQAVLDLHKKMEIDFFKRDAIVKEWIFSPFHFEKGLKDYKRKSFTRKPGAGMALTLLEKYALDLNASFMIGDKESDKLLLKGLNFLQIKGDYSIDKESPTCFNSLAEIHQHILEKID